jgi:hypothetical protein
MANRNEVCPHCGRHIALNSMCRCQLPKQTGLENTDRKTTTPWKHRP